MLALKRCFATSRKLLRNSDSGAKSIANVLEHQCFNPIRHQLPTSSELRDPYELSDRVSKAISELSDEEASAIHNRLIEELSQIEYGISQIHAKKLDELGRPLSSKSILEIVKNNPGRVSTSWELLLRYGPSLSLVEDELVVSALDNVLNSITVNEEDNKAHNLLSIAQVITLLNNLQDKTCISSEIVEKLVDVLIESDASCALPMVLQHVNFPLEQFRQRINSLTTYQALILSQFCPFKLLQEEENLLFYVVDTLGQNNVIAPTKEENQVAKELTEYLARVEKELPSDWKTGKLLSEPTETANDFLRIFESIQAEKLDEKNLKLAKKLLRIFGTFRNNTQISLELYHSYLVSFSKNATDLMFETFLALAYQAFRTSNKTLLKYAEVFIPQDIGQTMLTDVLRTLILTNGRFDIDKSLDIYNENIGSLSKNNDEFTNVSPSALVAEALILAYLSQQQLDFARVIFDGCAREKTISGLTATKRIKGYFVLYGEALENGKVEDVISHEILKVLRNL